MKLALSQALEMAGETGRAAAVGVLVAKYVKDAGPKTQGAAALLAAAAGQTLHHASATEAAQPSKCALC